MTLVFRSDIPMDTVLPGTPVSAGKARYRASFNISNRPNIIGEATGAGDGLTVGAWQGTENALGIANNRLVRGASTGTWSVGLPLLDNGASASIYVFALPVGGDLYLDIFRHALTGTPDAYRLILQPGGTAQLVQRVSGTNSYLGSVFNYAANQRIGLRWVGGLLEALLDNMVVSSVQTSAVAPSGFAAISGVTGTAGFELDEYYVDEY